MPRCEILLSYCCYIQNTFYTFSKRLYNGTAIMYDGQWFSPLRKALSAFVTSTQEHVTGKVRLELYKGNLINAEVWSPYSLYREDIATFAAGGDYKQSDATGFISIYGLPTKVQAIVNSEKKGNEVVYSSLCF